MTSAHTQLLTIFSIQLDLSKVRTAGDVWVLRAALTNLTKRVNAAQGARAFEAITQPNSNLTYGSLSRMMFQKLQQLKSSASTSQLPEGSAIAWQSIPGGENVPSAFDDLLVALEMPER